MIVTYTTEELAGLAGVSTWSLYEAARRGDCPFPFIRIGRRLVWPKAAANQLLGLEDPS